jgi:hypothetical protein
MGNDPDAEQTVVHLAGRPADFREFDQAADYGELLGFRVPRWWNGPPIAETESLRDATIVLVRLPHNREVDAMIAAAVASDDSKIVVPIGTFTVEEMQAGFYPTPFRNLHQFFRANEASMQEEPWRWPWVPDR